MKKHEKMSLTVVAVGVVGLLVYQFSIRMFDESRKWGICSKDVAAFCGNVSQYPNLKTGIVKCLINKKASLSSRCRVAVESKYPSKKRARGRVKLAKKAKKKNKNPCSHEMVKATGCGKVKQGDGAFWMCLAGSSQAATFPRGCHERILRFLTYGPKNCVNRALKKCKITKSKIVNAKCVVNKSTVASNLCKKWRVNLRMSLAAATK